MYRVKPKVDVDKNVCFLDYTTSSSCSHCTYNNHLDNFNTEESLNVIIVTKSGEEEETEKKLKKMNITENI